MQDHLFDLLGLRDRLIMDPIHGGITLYRHEVSIIDHPLFQRLRFICQNDILSMVFPGATHSRFLHSLGTMHVGGRMHQALMTGLLQQGRDRFGLYPDEKVLRAIAWCSRVVRLACLLHDCGHSSFSHQFSRSRTIQALLSEPDRLTRLWQGDDWRRLHRQEPETLEHEYISVRCAHRILDDVRTQATEALNQDVLMLMETTDSPPSPRFRESVEVLWPYVTGSREAPPDAAERWARLLGHIVSGEIDADRADYMLRDGFHSSVTLGSFNLDHLLKNLMVGWDPQENWLGLCVSPKGLGALEDFIYSRFQMYRKVYGHKTSIGFDWLLRQAVDEVLEEDEARAYIDECLSNLEAFQTLTDSYFWEAFRRRARRHPNSAAHDLTYRRRMRHLDSAVDLSPAEIVARKKDLAAPLEDQREAQEAILACSIKARFSKIDGGFRNIRVREGDAYRDIIECSEFFSKFRDQELFHFFHRPEYRNSGG